MSEKFYNEEGEDVLRIDKVVCRKLIITDTTDVEKDPLPQYTDYSYFGVETVPGWNTLAQIGGYGVVKKIAFEVIESFRSYIRITFDHAQVPQIGVTTAVPVTEDMHLAGLVSSGYDGGYYGVATPHEGATLANTSFYNDCIRGIHYAGYLALDMPFVNGFKFEIYSPGNPAAGNPTFTKFQVIVDDNSSPETPLRLYASKSFFTANPWEEYPVLTDKSDNGLMIRLIIAMCRFNGWFEPNEWRMYRGGDPMTAPVDSNHYLTVDPEVLDPPNGGKVYFRSGDSYSIFFNSTAGGVAGWVPNYTYGGPPNIYDGAIHAGCIYHLPPQGGYIYLGNADTSSYHSTAYRSFMDGMPRVQPSERLTVCLANRTSFSGPCSVQLFYYK